MSARLLLLGTSILLASCATAQENPNYQHSTKYGPAQTQVADNTAIVQDMSQPTPGAVYNDGPQHIDAQTYSAGTATAVTHTHVMGSDHDLTANHTIESNQVGYPTRAPILASNPQLQNTSPTEQAYDANRMQGTPGYEMMRAQQAADDTHPSYPPARPPVYEAAPAPSYTPYAPQTASQPPASQPNGARQVDYDYGENLRTSENAKNLTAAPTFDQMQGRNRAGTSANIGTGQSYTVRQGDTVYSLSRRLCAPIGDITTANGIGGDYAIAIGQTLNLPNSRC